MVGTLYSCPWHRPCSGLWDTGGLNAPWTGDLIDKWGPRHSSIPWNLSWKNNEAWQSPGKTMDKESEIDYKTITLCNKYGTSSLSSLQSKEKSSQYHSSVIYRVCWSLMLPDFTHPILPCFGSLYVIPVIFFFCLVWFCFVFRKDKLNWEYWNSFSLPGKQFRSFEKLFATTCLSTAVPQIWKCSQVKSLPFVLFHTGRVRCFWTKQNTKQ